MKSEFTEQGFKQLVQKVLNEEFLLGLQGGVRETINNRTDEFDLVDKIKKYYVEIKSNFESVNRAHLFNELRPRIASLQKKFINSSFNYILVFNSEISKNDREYFKSVFSDQFLNILIFDFSDIIAFSKKHFSTRPDEINEERINAIGSFDNENTRNEVLNFLELNNLYVAGYVWDNKDQSDRFLEEGIWEKYPQDGNENIINAVKEGDIIFLRTTAISETLRYIVIRGFGIVTQNLQNGYSLKVRWSLFNGTIKIDGLENYGRNFQKVIEGDKILILNRVLDEIPDFITRLDQLANDFLSKGKREVEVQIDRDRKFLIGLNVGVEIKDYDVIFLPKSSHGGIGQNGIAAHILEIFGRDRTEIEFSSQDLEEIGYKWVSVYTETKSIEVCFVVSKDINKNSLNFSDNLKNAIHNFSGAMSALNPPSEVTKIFIPLLGTGQAQLPVADSFNIINDVLRLFNEYFKNPQIRINFPQDIEKNTLLNYANVLITFHKLNEVENLSQQIRLLFDDVIKPVSNTIDATKNKIPFHLDQVVNEDELGREPVAKEFVRLIKSDIFKDKLNHSFMVHLQGKWGVGKSSFLNFIKKNLNSDEEKWIIVDYNAWQNQHITPPWWSLIDQVYLKSKQQLYLIGIRASWHLWRKELSRRIWRYSGWEKTLTFLIFIVCVSLFIIFRVEIAKLFTDENPSTGDALKALVAFISVIVSIYTLARFVTVPFFINSSKEAKSFILRASDPMNKIKKHFNDLVDDINSKKKKRQLAIFIDDIDRCDKEFIVKLLEGIQTLFKDKKVLYIVAGDKDWISTSFGKTYDDFVTEGTNKEQLGEFFIDKAFQLSFRLPNISEEAKQNYWDHILGLKTRESSKKITSIKDLSEDKQEEIKTVLKESKSQLTNPDFVKQMQSDFNLTGDTASNLVIEEKNKDTQELKHLLQEYHMYIDTNPRSIIRLANNYTMSRTILMAERVRFNEHKLFRWLVIEDLCPKVKGIVSNVEKISEIVEIIKASNDIVKRNNSLKLLEGNEEFMEGKITIEEIKIIKGY